MIHVRVLILTVDGEGRFVAVMNRQGLVSLETKSRVRMQVDACAFTASGVCGTSEWPHDAAIRLLREQLELTPGNLKSEEEQRNKEPLQIKKIAEESFAKDEMRVFYVVFAGNNFLDAVRLRASSGGLQFVTANEVENIDWYLNPTLPIAVDTAAPAAILKAFEVFEPAFRLATSKT